MYLLRRDEIALVLSCMLTAEAISPHLQIVYPPPSAGRRSHLGQIECGDEADRAALISWGRAGAPRARAHVPIINLAAVKSYRGRCVDGAKLPITLPKSAALAQSIAKAAAAGDSRHFLSACPLTDPFYFAPDCIGTLHLNLPNHPHPLGRRQRPEAVAPGAPSPPEPRGPLLVENVYPTRLPNSWQDWRHLDLVVSAITPEDSTLQVRIFKIL